MHKNINNQRVKHPYKKGIFHVIKLFDIGTNELPTFYLNKKINKTITIKDKIVKTIKKKKKQLS